MRLLGVLVLLAVPATATFDEIVSLPRLDYPIKFKQYSGFLQASPTRFIHYCNASPIYMESPVGVGYSYATDRNLTNDDETASMDNYEALKQFYARYPALWNRTLFLTGEEYATRTAAHLAKRIIDGNPSFPLDLQGILVADADADSHLTAASFWHYAHSQRLMSERNWQRIVENCCPNHAADECFYNYFNFSLPCSNAMSAMDGLYTWQYNLYDIRYECGFTPFSGSRMIQANNTVMKDTNYAYRSCYEYGRGLETYLNRDDVREALHVSESAANWTDGWSAKCVNYYSLSRNATDVYRFLLGSGLRVLFYYGERNVANNYEGGSRFADSLGLSYDPDRDVDNAPWYLATEAHFDGTFSGIHRTFAVGNLSVVMIRNAGAAAARTASLEVNYIVRTFMQGMPL
ncbi:Protein F41C3.5 [Aphelenchoides avenae]|nr:Protein F41C3.5 [Aphelenchus avenae]